MTDEQLSHKEVAGRGGRARVNNQTPEERSALAKLGGDALKTQKGPDYYREIGRRGGAAKAAARKARELEQQNGTDKATPATSETEITPKKTSKWLGFMKRNK